MDPVTGRVDADRVQGYRDPDSPEHTTGTVRGTVFVLAANAIENARLMLASSLPGSSGLVGRNLMDHAYLLTWALMPEVAGTYRGPPMHRRHRGPAGWVLPAPPRRVRARHPQRRLGMGDRIAVLRRQRAGGSAEQVRR